MNTRIVAPALFGTEPNVRPVRRCPSGCDLGNEILCNVRHERELRVALIAARRADSPDAEVLAFDVRNAGRHIDALIALGRRAP